MKSASLGTGVMLLGVLAASACGDSGSSSGTTPTGGAAGSGNAAGSAGNAAGSAGAAGGKAGAGGVAGGGATAGSGAGSSGSAGVGGSTGGGAGAGGTAGSGGVSGNGGSSGSSAGDAGEEGDAGADSGGTAGMGGTAGSGGASAGTGGMAGTAGATDECDFSTRALLATCERPVTGGGSWSCTEFYEGNGANLQVVEFECENANGIFSDSPCPATSFEDLDRIGCCVAPGAVNRSCYYGAGNVEGIRPLCESLGCMLEPG